MHEAYLKLVLDEETFDTLLVKLVFLDLGEGRVQMLVERHGGVFRLYALGSRRIIVLSSMFLLEWRLGAWHTIWEAGQIIFERKFGFGKLI